MTTRGQAKILDFGLAKMRGPGQNAPTPGSRSPALDAPTVSIDREALTNPGRALGTVAYVSPEQARGQEVDTRTDLFSFGTVLYEMATGGVAFSGDTTAVIFDGILNRAPAALRQINAALPAQSVSAKPGSEGNPKICQSLNPIILLAEG